MTTMKRKLYSFCVKPESQGSDAECMESHGHKVKAGGVQGRLPQRTAPKLTPALNPKLNRKGADGCLDKNVWK
jgi:hypothetical protein